MSVDRKIVEVGRAFRLSARRWCAAFCCPRCCRPYVIALRSGLGLGWMFVVAAELLGASEGLGYLLIDGQQLGKPAQIVAAIVAFAIIGKLTDWLIVAIARAVPALGRPLRARGRPDDAECSNASARPTRTACARSTASRSTSSRARSSRWSAAPAAASPPCCAPSPGSTRRARAASCSTATPITAPHEKIGIIFQEPRLLPWLHGRGQCRFRPRATGRAPSARARRAARWRASA